MFPPKQVPPASGPAKIDLSDPKYGRLLADAERICQQAGIPRWRLEQSAVGVLNEQELDWLKNFRTHAQLGRGYVLVGQTTTIGPEARFGSLTAALLRNFIDARSVPFSAVLSALTGESDSEVQDPTVLCIPNFYLAHSGGKQFPAWRIQAAHDYFINRYNQARVTVLYVEDWGQMQAEYGMPIARHIAEHFIRIEAQ